MSDSKSTGVSLGGLWLLMFIIIKVGGTSLASWSWWWLLLPIVPDVVFILHKMGYTL
jgi:hypothetical protein